MVSCFDQHPCCSIAAWAGRGRPGTLSAPGGRGRPRRHGSWPGSGTPAAVGACNCACICQAMSSGALTETTSYEEQEAGQIWHCATSSGPGMMLLYDNHQQQLIDRATCRRSALDLGAHRTDLNGTVLQLSTELPQRLALCSQLCICMNASKKYLSMTWRQ